MVSAKNAGRIDVWPTRALAKAANDPPFSKQIGRMVIWPTLISAKANTTTSTGNKDSMVRASLFDGKTYLEVAGGGISPAFPASSSFGLLSYWYNAKSNPDMMVVVSVHNIITRRCVLFVGHQIVAGQSKLQVVLSDETALKWGSCLGTTSLPTDEQWHHVIILWDTSTQSLVYKVDGATGVLASNTWIGGGFEISYLNCMLRVAADDVANTPAYNKGMLAELFLELGTERNINTVVDKFIDNELVPVSEDGKPVVLGAHGELPLVTEENPDGTPPTIYGSGGKSKFLQPNLGTGGDFILTGTLDNADSEPKLVA